MAVPPPPTCLMILALYKKSSVETAQCCKQMLQLFLVSVAAGGGVYKWLLQVCRMLLAHKSPTLAPSLPERPSTPTYLFAQAGGAQRPCGRHNGAAFVRPEVRGQLV